MADSFVAKWPVAESSAVELANGCSYLTAKQAAGLYNMPYSTFIKRLKDFVQYGEYPPVAFRVDHRLNPDYRQHWIIGVHPVLGIRALNRHFYPRLCEQ